MEPEPELVVPSARTPDPGCAPEEAMLALPLLLSSSVRLLPPVECAAFLCPNALLYLLGGAGALGDTESKDGCPCSAAAGEPLDTTAAWVPADCGVRASARTASGDDLPKDPLGMDAPICSSCEGEADKEGVLKGMNDTEGLLPALGGPSAERSDDLDPWADLVLGGIFLGIMSSGDSDPATRAARRADNGLVPVGGPTW